MVNWEKRNLRIFANINRITNRHVRHVVEIASNLLGSHESTADFPRADSWLLDGGCSDPRKKLILNSNAVRQNRPYPKWCNFRTAGNPSINAESAWESR